MNFRDIIKSLSGACCAAVMMMYSADAVGMPPQAHVGENTVHAGKLIMPEMSIKNLTFREIRVPPCLEKYKHDGVITCIKGRFKAIRKVGIANPGELGRLVDGIVADDYEAESLIETMRHEDNAALYSVQHCMAMRLLELGEWNFCWVHSLFYINQQTSRRYADSLLRNGAAVSADLLAQAGRYIELLDVIKQGRASDVFPAFREKLGRIDRTNLPKSNFISWGLDLAEQDQ
ncbi:MAG: hypothetical protein LBF54_02105 [Holosporaceae bacterium]|jgi:hypothetical protein|nr:hypothetical protein [Holosporaceae bacterium]